MASHRDPESKFSGSCSWETKTLLAFESWEMNIWLVAKVAGRNLGLTLFEGFPPTLLSSALSFTWHLMEHWAPFWVLRACMFCFIIISLHRHTEFSFLFSAKPASYLSSTFYLQNIRPYSFLPPCCCLLSGFLSHCHWRFLLSYFSSFILVILKEQAEVDSSIHSPYLTRIWKKGPHFWNDLVFSWAPKSLQMVTAAVK